MGAMMVFSSLHARLSTATLYRTTCGVFNDYLGRLVTSPRMLYLQPVNKQYLGQKSWLIHNHAQRDGRLREPLLAELRTLSRHIIFNCIQKCVVYPMLPKSLHFLLQMNADAAHLCYSRL